MYVLEQRRQFAKVQAECADSGAVDRSIHHALLPICVAYHMRRESLREQYRVGGHIATGWNTYVSVELMYELISVHVYQV